MKRKINLTLNGFHGYQSHTVLVEIEEDLRFTGNKELDYYSGISKYIGTIADSAAKRFSCGMNDCCCGESVPKEFPIDDNDLKFRSVEIRGNYPQNS